MFVLNPSRNWMQSVSCLTLIQIAAGLAQGDHSQTCNRPCPRACVADEADQWDFYHYTASLAVCAEPILLDFNLFKTTGNDSTSSDLVKRACTLGDATTSAI